MTDRAKAITYGLLLVLAFAAGWLVNGWRSDARIARVELTQTSKELQQTQQAAQKMADTQKGFDDALQAFQGTQKDNAKAQQDLGRVLLDLRSTTAGLRGDFSSLPARIAGASKPALNDFAQQCISVLQSMADAGGNLAERGADIARKADEHAANERLIFDSWGKH